MIAGSLILGSSSILISGGLLVDGSGAKPRIADVRLRGSAILAIGSLKPLRGETVISAKGLVVSPGFIDAHSHALGGIEKEPTALSQLMQGITTAVGGQDGGWSQPIAKEFAEIERIKPSINFALFSGHGGLRAEAMGKDYKRVATAAEIERMKALLSADMRAGALGLSSGLEYDPGYYSDTNELVQLAKVAKQGIYISHVRDEADKAMEAFQELAKIGKEGSLHAQISHIKLGSKAVWNKTADVLKLIEKEKLTADVYPYTYWQSTIAALSPSRDWENDEIWVKALDDVGGPQNVRLSTYTPNPAWVGKNLEEIAKETGKTPIKIIQEILRTTNEEGRQSVVVTAMQESDLIQFIKHPRIMFCSDGSIGGSHPRGAGSFPRIIGRYVREKKVISLQEAIRKMTSFPAQVFKLKNRGWIKKGYVADIVVFDPKTITDHATPTDSTALSTGVREVFVNGVHTIQGVKFSGMRAGLAISRGL
ncbi:MAG: D-aminoacylase [Armatimonadota bacterium]